jgi:hypothetical protein
MIVAGNTSVLYAALERAPVQGKRTRDEAVRVLRKAQDPTPHTFALCRSSAMRSLTWCVVHSMMRPGRELRGMAYRVGLAG